MYLEWTLLQVPLPGMLVSCIKIWQSGLLICKMFSLLCFCFQLFYHLKLSLIFFYISESICKLVSISTPKMLMKRFKKYLIINELKHSIAVLLWQMHHIFFVKTESYFYFNFRRNRLWETSLMNHWFFPSIRVGKVKYNCVTKLYSPFTID